MAILKFKLTIMPLRHCKDGNSRIVTPRYSDYSIFLDRSVVKYLKDCQRLIFLNANMFLIIETENDKHWKISQTTPEGVLWGGNPGGKIIIRNEEKKIKILCTEADIYFRISKLSE